MLLIRETQEQKAEQLESKTSLKSINKYVQHAHGDVVAPLCSAEPERSALELNTMFCTRGLVGPQSSRDDRSTTGQSRTEGLEMSWTNVHEPRPQSAKENTYHNSNQL